MNITNPPLSMTEEEEAQYYRGRREGARSMAMELAFILSRHDRKNGDKMFIMAKDSTAEMCEGYATMDDPLDFIELNKARNNG